jgi:hypothetical protein
MNWENDIQALEEEHCRAFVGRDYDRLEGLWSDNLIVNSPINRVHDKKRVLELLRAGWRRAQPGSAKIVNAKLK